jgi:hypothetical protein
MIGSGRLYGSKGDSIVTETRVTNGMELRKGMAKGVRIVRDDDGRAVPSVVLDGNIIVWFTNFVSYQSNYSKSQSLLQKATTRCYRRRNDCQPTEGGI